jgi:basic amino acid/polyamine antiporter, APA family
VPYQFLNNAAPMAAAVDAAYQQSIGGPWQSIMSVMPFLVKLGAIAGLSSTMVVMMLGQPRIFFSMSKDGLLPGFASKVHPKFRTPYITTLITGIVVAIAAGFTGIGILGELVSIGTLFAFVIVSIGVIFLRYKRPDLERPFKTPFVPLVPILSALVSIALMASLGGETWTRLIIWMAIGIVIYFGYGYRKSKLRLEEASSKPVTAD